MKIKNIHWKNLAIVILTGLLIASLFLIGVLIYINQIYKNKYEKAIEGAKVEIFAKKDNQIIFDNFSDPYVIEHDEKTLDEIFLKHEDIFKTKYFPAFKSIFIDGVLDSATGKIIYTNDAHFWNLKFYEDNVNCPASNNFSCKMGINYLNVNPAMNVVELDYADVGPTNYPIIYNIYLLNV